jgi:sugar O-acyltransferase (sialic acid O-acetyltransferase NeuD family)
VTDLVIFGAGDIARLALFYFTTDSPYRVAGFTVDRAYRQSDVFEGLPIVDFEDVEARFPPSSHDMFVAVSYAKMNRVRAAKYAEAKRRGYTLASYVSSRATVLTTQPVGDNCFILEDNTIQPFVRIGRDVTLWSGNHIGHDSTIGDHCFIASHVVVSGHCTIGESCFIGVNATLRNSITIADRTLVGAGAVILGDTREGEVYVPQRAAILPKSSDQFDL